MAVLLVADHDNAHLNPATARALTAARAIDETVDILVAGRECRAVADAAARLQGVRRVLLADGEALAHQLAENMEALIVPLMADYTHLLAAATTTGKNFAPRVAARLDVMQISEIVEVIDADTFRRPIYAGNAIETVRSRDARKVITVRTTAFGAAGTGDEEAPVEEIPAPAPSPLVEFVSRELTQSDRPELTQARVVISGGRGMGSREAFEMLERIARKLNAAVGASRAAVDAGYVPNDYQVGQTGKVVAPDLYIAVGISGAIQHLAGMKDSRVIVAINKDEEAPIFQVADYGLVADLFEALPELEKELDRVLGHEGESA
jgi:electron transfer flavoprotein alpha subunit